MSKGQAQVVTAVLLAGIIVAGVSAVYTWGVPLLQKNQDIKSLQGSLDDLRQLESAIETVAQRGGSNEVSFAVNDGQLRVLPDDNAIVYSVRTKAAYVSTTEWVPLNENDMRGIEEANRSSAYGINGRDKPGVIIGKAFRQGEGYRSVYRLEFRELQDLNSDRGYIIDIQTTGDQEASGGTHQITIEKVNSITEEGASKTGGPLVRRIIRIQVQ
ncbi:MAG: hypothetical protein SVU32_03585 [Candidatus Nanohaloarchaea archaeon]|nr:hypothetical protein [Candidatus Nanohaloarchaea archaeon]